MTKDEIRNKLEEMRGRYGSFTAADKRSITYLCRASMIEMPSTNCPNCYDDRYLLLRKMYGKEESKDCGRWLFAASEPMMWNGIVLDEHTDEGTIEKFVRIFKNQHFYKPKNEENENQE